MLKHATAHISQRYLQMNNLIVFILLFTLNLVYAQNIEQELQFRKLEGILVDENQQPFPGQTIIIKGTDIGAITDFDGKFCLVVPKEQTIFIELPFCFDQIFREINPNIDTLTLAVGENKRKSRKALKKYQRNRTELNSKLYKIYNSEIYEQSKDICK